MPATGGRRFVITDEHVGPLYADLLGPRDGLVRIAAGETSKTLASAELVWRELAQAGVARDDHLVGLGGGVVGDLAGFCAATYQRGVPIVHVPTTLVAQVDSAYGGKTGVDLPEAKNYVGAYHQPAGVVVDTATLDTLPAAEARRRLRRGAQDRADRRGRAVAAGRRGRAGRRRDRDGVRPRSSCRSSPRTSVTGDGGRCSTSDTRWATRSRS